MLSTLSARDSPRAGSGATAGCSRGRRSPPPPPMASGLPSPCARPSALSPVPAPAPARPANLSLLRRDGAMDVVGDIFAFLGAAELLECERLCRRARHIIAARGLWRTLFVRRCVAAQQQQAAPPAAPPATAAAAGGDAAAAAAPAAAAPATVVPWIAPSADPSEGWKRYYYAYQADLKLRVLSRHNYLSQCLRWRVQNLLPPGRDSAFFSVPLCPCTTCSSSSCSFCGSCSGSSGGSPCAAHHSAPQRFALRTAATELPDDEEEDAEAPEGAQPEGPAAAEGAEGPAAGAAEGAAAAEAEGGAQNGEGDAGTVVPVGQPVRPRRRSGTSSSLWWRIGLTLNPTANNFGVFLHQNRAADCYFTFTLLHPSTYEEVCTPLATRHKFPGDGQQSGWGWLFPLSQFEERGVPMFTDPQTNQRGLSELVVQLELIHFPGNDPASALPRAQLLRLPSLSPHCRLHIAHSLHWLIHDDRATKLLLHSQPSSTLAFVELLEDLSAPQDLRLQVARILWDILDVSDIRLPVPQIQRTVAACCRNIGQSLEYLDMDPKQVAMEIYLYLGVLMNLPVLPMGRGRPTLARLLVNEDHCMEFLFAVLAETRLCNSHIICLQILTTLCAQRVLPAPLLPRLDTAVSNFLRCPFPSVSPDFGTDMDITFSLRDIADFFLPLLRCGNLSCIALAKLCIEEAYFGTKSKWKSGYLFSIQSNTLDIPTSH